MGYPTGLGQVALRSVPFRVPFMAPQPSARFQNLPRQAVAPPTTEQVLTKMYGSVEKGQAAIQASIDEARQRDEEIRSRTPQVFTQRALPPVGLSPLDVAPPPPQLSPTEDFEEEPSGGDAEAIEETAENGEEEVFEGWAMGLDERIVGVTDRLRRSVPAMHVRRDRSLRERMMQRAQRAKRRRRKGA